MSDLKKEWSETGKAMGDAFLSLGKAVVSSAKVGIDKASEWVNNRESLGKVEEGKKDDSDKE